jgi:hypothetical protein
MALEQNNARQKHNRHYMLYGIYVKSKPEICRNKKSSFETHYQVLRVNTGPTNSSEEGIIHSIKQNLIFFKLYNKLFQKTNSYF